MLNFIYIINIKMITIGKIRNYILDYLDNEIDYEYLEDMIIQYSKEKHKSINLDYIRNRIYNLYKLKGLLGITEFDILLKHILDLFKTK